MTDALPYIYVALLIVASAFFSSSETAFASANGLRLKNNAKVQQGWDRCQWQKDLSSARGM